MLRINLHLPIDLSGFGGPPFCLHQTSRHKDTQTASPHDGDVPYQGEIDSSGI